MKNVFKPGDVKIHRFKVSENDVAQFDLGLVHDVCSTFKLAKEIEWSSRLFVLDMIEAYEEGIGTHLSIDHKSPAFPGEEVEIEAIYKALKGNELFCDINARAGGRVVAKGITGQKILNKEKINEIFSRLNK